MTKRLLLLMSFLLLLFTACLPTDDKPRMFTNKWRLYKLPLNVSWDWVALGTNADEIYELATKREGDGKWIYACENFCDIDPATNQLILGKPEGHECYIRYFNQKRAEIFILWFRIKVEQPNLRACIEYIRDQEFTTPDIDRNKQNEPVIREIEIGGCSALEIEGIKSKVYVNTSIVAVRELGKIFIISFECAEDNLAAKKQFFTARNGIIFLKQPKASR